MNGWLDGWMDGWMVGWIGSDWRDKRVDGLVDGRDDI